jgi:DNA polymerase-1
LRNAPKRRRKARSQASSRPRQRVRAQTTRTKAEAARRPLLAIDGDLFAHRSYHALPKTILRRDGRPAGAILGFANVLLRFYQFEQPRAVLVAWDTLDVPTYRHRLFPAYQSGREFDAELIEQLYALPEMVAAFGFVNAKAPGYEADDLLAAAAAAEQRRGGSVLIASGDRDTFQLVSKHSSVLFPVRAGEVARIGPDEVYARYGVAPHQVPDFIALRGDSSDRLPGAAGIGADRAASLLQRYGTLEAILETGRFPSQAERLRLFRSIATMDRRAPLPRLPDQKPTWERAATLVAHWGLNQLAQRLRKL